MSKMELYYINETLYIELLNDLDLEEYQDFKKRVFRILDDYGIERIVVKNHRKIFHNRHFLNQMKQDYLRKYSGDFFIK